MSGFLEPVDLDLNQVRVIVRGMVRVAHSDGAHERELVLIREFYEGCRAEVKGLADFADVARGPFDAAEAGEQLSSDALKLTFLVSCYLVAYADGHVSDGEKKVLAELVKELGVSEALSTQAQDLVKDQLLMQLARSANLEALKDIAAKL